MSIPFFSLSQSQMVQAAEEIIILSTKFDKDHPLTIYNGDPMGLIIFIRGGYPIDLDFSFDCDDGIVTITPK